VDELVVRGITASDSTYEYQGLIDAIVG